MIDSDDHTLVECALPAAYSQGFVQARIVVMRRPHEADLADALQPPVPEGDLSCDDALAG